MKFVVGENGRNPEKNLPRPRFVHHETHMEGPSRELGTPAVGGERLTACAMRPPSFAPNIARKKKVTTAIQLVNTVETVTILRAQHQHPCHCMNISLV